MGILDSKTRVFDTIITQEGKRQLAFGKMKIEYVSFSDDFSFYTSKEESGEVTNRIYFEANSQYQDQICFEADDSGLLLPFPNSVVEIANGSILSSSNGYYNTVTGSQFSSLSETLLNESLRNLSDLKVISTTDDIFDDYEFSLSSNEINFDLTNDSPLENQDFWKVHINDIDSLLEDQKFSNITNFKYLPPTTKQRLDTGEEIFRTLSTYKKYTPKEYEEKEVKNDVEVLKKSDLLKEISFLKTSINNTLCIQVFESDTNKLKKLDAFKFFEYTDENSDLVEIYFLGKLIPDENQSYNFVHIFTLIFS